MRIHSKLVYQWCDRLDKYILVEDHFYPFSGQIAFCKGAGQQLTNISQSQQNFMNTLQKDFGTAFQGQQNILNTLSKSLTSIVQGGPSQYGFSPEETSALNTLATTGTAQQYENAKQAAGAAAAAAGGGNVVLPSSAAAQQQADIAQQAAQTSSSQLLGIKEAGYQQGNKNFQDAIRGLTGVASVENPTGVAGQANEAGRGASSTATTVQKMNNAASPWNVVGGILGGVAGTAADAFTGGLSGAIGGGISSVLNGASNTLPAFSFSSPPSAPLLNPNTGMAGAPTL